MKTPPYVILSDLHLHNWSAFAQPTAEGINSRLAGLLSEIKRAAQTLKAAGGRDMILSGDLFHVRGNIAPSVLNPTIDTFKEVRDQGVDVHIIPGNHDLEGRDSLRLSSAVTALEQLGCRIYNRAQQTVMGGNNIIMVPWIESVAALKTELLDLAQEVRNDCKDPAQFDVIIHAPVNGVIMGIPDHGLEPAWVAQLGFRRVFAGHYHNHVVFEDGKVVSVGALAHHTWGDIGTRAGFLMVTPDAIEAVDSALPKFVEIHQHTPAGQVPAIARGNYVRVKVETSKVADIDAMRQYLTDQGALGVVVISVKKPENVRAEGATVQAGASISTSVMDFIKVLKPARQAQVEQSALRILAEAEIA